MAKKRVNPRRQPMTRAEAEKRARDYGIDCALALFFTAALDKGFVAKEQILSLWKATEDLSDSVAKGYVNMADLMRTLRDEYGIIFN